MEATSLRFAAAARALGHAARRRGLVVPGFRSPPRLPEVDRSLRRRPDGHAMIAIRLRGRPWMAVISDMVEGVVAANGLTGADADGARRALWACLEAEALLPPAPPPPPPRPTAVRSRAATRPRRADAQPARSEAA